MTRALSRSLFRLAAGCLLLAGLTTGCAFDTAGLAAAHDGYYCGDGRVDDDIGEDCEGENLLGWTCQMLGFTDGTLSCTADCRFDRSDCSGTGVCGDGFLSAGEYCDGTELRGVTCESLGYAGGVLSCADDCTLDESACEDNSPCGDGLLDPGEDCDGANLGDETCESLGMGTGDLVCNEMCAYDLGGCSAPVCGDGGVDGDETCDDGENDECTGHCNADCTGPANVCGDGVVRCGEQCEAGDLQGLDCTYFGYAAPAGLACGDHCEPNPTGCHTDCGNGVLDAGEVCEDGNTDPANATTDFCSPLCTTETWTCAGSWPGYLPPTNTDEAWVTFTNTSLAGSPTRYVTGAAGSVVNISGNYAYDKVASGCTGCVVQLYWGFFAGDPPAAADDPNAGFKHCINGVQNTPSAAYSFSLTLPTQPGTYYLRWGRSWEYNCSFDNIDAHDAGRSLAVICVY